MPSDIPAAKHNPSPYNINKSAFMYHGMVLLYCYSNVLFIDFQSATMANKMKHNVSSADRITHEKIWHDFTDNRFTSNHRYKYLHIHTPIYIYMYLLKNDQAPKLWDIYLTVCPCCYQTCESTKGIRMK